MAFSKVIEFCNLTMKKYNHRPVVVFFYRSVRGENAAYVIIRWEQP